MNFKSILALFGVMLFGAGIVMAIAGASTTLVEDKARWVGNSATSRLIEGGNISNVNISGTTLTDRWAAYFGNVSGTVVLQDSAAAVYTWTWAPTAGGTVCLSTNATYATAAAVAAGTADAPALNTAFTMGVAADNATNTFTTASCTVNLVNKAAITTAANVTTTNGFNTCLLKDGATGAKDDFAFCTAINATGLAYNGDAATYQVMVPTTPGATQETYYFYADLN